MLKKVRSQSIYFSKPIHSSSTCLCVLLRRYEYQFYSVINGLNQTGQTHRIRKKKEKYVMEFFLVDFSSSNTSLSRRFKLWNKNFVYSCSVQFNWMELNRNNFSDAKSLFFRSLLCEFWLHLGYFFALF